jgi:hypothetical protein
MFISANSALPRMLAGFAVASGLVSGCVLDQAPTEGEADVETTAQAAVFPTPVISSFLTTPTYPGDGGLAGTNASVDLPIIHGVWGLLNMTPGGSQVRLAVYDWDQYWNTYDGSGFVNPQRFVTAPGNNCRGDGLAGPAFCGTQQHWAVVDQAVARGVSFKALFNFGASTPGVRQWLAGQAGTNNVRICRNGFDPGDADNTGGSCLGDNDMHAKFMTISAVSLAPIGNIPGNVFVQTGNFNYNQLLEWNAGVWIANDTPLHDAIVRHFDGNGSCSNANMWCHSVTEAQAASGTETNPPNIGSEFADGDRGIVRVYFSPRNSQTPFKCSGGSDNNDTVCSILNNTERNGKLLVAMSHWSDSERGRQIVDRLGALRSAGVDVRVIYSHRVGPAIIARLNARRVPNWVTSGTIRMHLKYMTYAGTYDGGPTQRLVFMGSQNFTKPALRDNDEILLKMKECESAPCTASSGPSAPSNTVHRDFSAHWCKLCSKTVPNSAFSSPPLVCTCS